MPRITQLLAESENAIIESNSILRFLQPDLCAMVVDGAVADFKPTALEFIDRADFLVAHERRQPSPGRRFRRACCRINHASPRLLRAMKMPK